MHFCQIQPIKYVGLDFGHLVELSTIDMHFRKLILKLTIDLEHYLKVKLVNDCQENSRDDGYKVVEDFFEKHPKIKESVTATIYLASYSVSEIKHLEKLAVWNKKRAVLAIFYCGCNQSKSFHIVIFEPQR